MARRARADFDAELLLRLANRTDITSTQRGFFLDDAYLKICNLFRHVQLQAISATETLLINQDNWTPSVSDFWYPTALRNVTDGYIIRPDSLQRVERAVTKPTAPPYTYYWYGGVMYHESFANTQKTIKVWYKKIPPAWSTGSPVFDQIFDKLIVPYAAEIGFETVRDFDNAEREARLATKHATENKLPLDDAKLDDYRTGWKMRFK